MSLALLLIAAVAHAESIGTVTHLEGVLVASRADGSVKVLGVASEIEAGDILSSRKQTYAAVTLADNSTVTLGADSDLKIERYVFHKHVPDGDGAVLALANGSVRITAGVLGTRSSEETFTLATPTASLDIRGASLIVEYVASERAALAWRDPSPRHPGSSNWVPVSYAPGADSDQVRTTSDSPSQRLAQVTPPAAPTNVRPPGLYVQVLDGLIHVTNSGGTQNFTAGQFGFTPSVSQPPIIVPRNPGIQFTPPPVFSVAPSATKAADAPKTVDCEVR